MEVRKVHPAQGMLDYSSNYKILIDPNKLSSNIIHPTSGIILQYFCSRHIDGK